MASLTGIEWTDATWNPVVGCSIVSPGCTNCYAMAMAARIEKMNPGSHYDGTTKRVNGNAVWTGKVSLAPDHILTQPLRWKKPRRIFVNSMGDLFHEAVSDEWIDKIFAVMALCPQHTFQVLTKRSKRMREYLQDMHPSSSRVIAIRHATAPFVALADDQSRPYRFPLPNVWLGVSTEDQTRADERLGDLFEIPAAVRFISYEPAIGRFDLCEQLGMWWNSTIGTWESTGDAINRDKWGKKKLDWLICGGESGPDARPMHPDWARSIRDQCAAAGVPFFFKQWGEWAADEQTHFSGFSQRGHAVAMADGRILVAGTDYSHDKAAANFGDRAVNVWNVGKARAGRLLDGIEHNAMPEANK